MTSVEIIILQIALYFPLLMAVLTFFIGKYISEELPKLIAIITMALETLFIIYLWIALFGDGTGDLHASTPVTWFSISGLLEVTYHVGIDGLSMPLLALTIVVFFVSIISSFFIKENEKAYYPLVLFLLTGIIGTFVALDLFLFYVFWELVLVPMFIIILIWGGSNRVYAGFKFFIYTHLASLLLLIGIFLMVIYATPSNLATPTTNMLVLKQSFLVGTVSTGITLIIFILLFIGFVTKFPQVPVHTWLPDAHVQAPSPGSAILAGLLLKLGGYGLIRVGFWIIMDSGFFSTYEGKVLRYVLLTIAVVSMIYPALVALRQTDLKKMIAYSSISHMGTVLLGLAAFNQLGFAGAIFMLVAHGVISPALFLICGVIEHNTKNHTRDIEKVSGLIHKMPYIGALLLFFAFASVGLPLLAGFVAEFLAFAGLFSSTLASSTFGLILAFLAVISLIITVSYYLRAVRKVAFGPASEELENTKPAKSWEIAPIFVLAIFTLVLGVLPVVIMTMINGWIQGIGF